MPSKRAKQRSTTGGAGARTARARDTTAQVSTPVEDLLLAAQERGDESLETGRYLITFKEGASEDGIRSLGTKGKGRGMRVANARDFDDQAATFESLGDVDALAFPEIGVALVGATAAAEHAMDSDDVKIAADSPIESIEPEYFSFPNAVRESFAGDATEVAPQIDRDYLRGFVRAAQAIATDLGVSELPGAEAEVEEEALVSGATWGLIACKVPPSTRAGVGIRVAVLDDGMDLGHPDFSGRVFVTKTFVGVPVPTAATHGTHLTGTACGPKAPPGLTPRYGIAYRTPIFIGKIFTNGMTTTATVLAAFNWAIANKCVAIVTGAGSASPLSPAYTAAGAAALARGCLIIAPAGGSAGQVGAPANSPTIMSVASLDPNLNPSSFSNFGKIDIAAPGRDIFSSVPRPRRYATMSGTSSAAAHVAGCAALWAETSPTLRGRLLWQKLTATAKRLPFPPARVGAGLVQSPP
jgi:subtilisin family serine protease